MNELKHYGVLGMKWGVRKADRLSAKVSSLQKKREELRNAPQGVLSNKFRNTSKNLYVTKAKLEVANAKNNPDKYARKVDTLAAKNDLSYAKWVKKAGTANHTLTSNREIYGSKLTSNEAAAINTLEFKAEKGRKMVSKFKGVAIGALSSLAIAEGKLYLETGKFGIPFVGKVDGRFQAGLKYQK